MRFGRWLGVLGIAVLAGGLWYAVGPHLRAEESPEREFYLSSDPAVEVLKVRYLGRTHFVPTYTLYPNGRLLYEERDQRGETTFRQREIQLTEKQVRDLMELAVFGGLMEFDKDEVQAQVKARHPSLYAHDAGTMFVDLQLEYYRGPSRPEGGSTSRSFSFRAPWFTAQQLPEIGELQTLAALGSQLKEHRLRMDQPHED